MPCRNDACYRRVGRRFDPAARGGAIRLEVMSLQDFSASRACSSNADGGHCSRRGDGAACETLRYPTAGIRAFACGRSGTIHGFLLWNENAASRAGSGQPASEGQGIGSIFPSFASPLRRRNANPAFTAGRCLPPFPHAPPVLVIPGSREIVGMKESAGKARCRLIRKAGRFIE